MKNALDTSVSYFKTCLDAGTPVTVNLLTYLRSERHRAAVERIRQTDDAEERARLKKDLPGITPSGIFSHRAETGLIRHSGLLAGDIDFKENPWNAESIKRELAKSVNMAYVGLSASGAGVWFLVPIAEPEHHREHFAALVADFARLGIRLDPAPANVASFRYYSYDLAAYFNPNAEPYTRKVERRPETYTPAPAAPLDTNDGVKVESIVSQLEAGRLDITANRDVWFALLNSLASLGEAGRDYAHRVSQFYPGYTTRETDWQFTKCLQWTKRRATLGTFFELAKQAGVTYKGTLPSGAAPTASRVTLPRPDHAGAQAAQVQPITAAADHSAAPITPSKTPAADHVTDSPALDAGAAEVEALAAGLAALDLPRGPLSLASGESITDPAAFVAGHLEMLRGHAGAAVKAPYRARLEAFAQVVAPCLYRDIQTKFTS